jgi:hypothetical protein
LFLFFVLLLLLLLLHLATHFALELIKSLNLLGGQNSAHLRANAGIDSYFVRLRRRKRFRRTPHFGLIVRLAHYGAIEGLAGQSQSSAGSGEIIFVASSNLLHAHSLRGGEPYRLHPPHLQLLLSYLIRAQRPIASNLRTTNRPVDSTLPERHSVVSTYLRINRRSAINRGLSKRDYAKS